MPVYPFPFRDPYGFPHISCTSTKNDVFSHVRGDASMAAPKNQGVLINKLRLGVKLSGEKKNHPYYFPWNPGCLIGIPIMGYNKPYNKGQYNTLYNLNNQGFFLAQLDQCNPKYFGGSTKMSPCPSTHHLFSISTNTPNFCRWSTGSLHWSIKHTINGSRSTKLQLINPPPLTYLPSEIEV